MTTPVDTAIAYAEAQIGDPYRWGGTGPDAWDCSGLVQAAYARAGVTLGRTTYQQVMAGVAVKKTDLLPGDLVFPDAGHVQIYVGGGKVVEAPRTGATVREVPMWGFWTARRVATGGALSSGAAVPGAAGTDTTGQAVDLTSTVTQGLGGTLTKITVVILAGALVAGGLWLTAGAGKTALA